MRQVSEQDYGFISHDERVWAEEVFDWLVTGYCVQDKPQMWIDDHALSNTLSDPDAQIQAVLRKLSGRLGLDASTIDFEWTEDELSQSGTVLTPVGSMNAFEVETLQHADGTMMVLGKSLQDRPQRLLARLALELTCLELSKELDGDESCQDIAMMAGVYFGFGVLFARGLNDSIDIQHSGGATRAESTMGFSPALIGYGLAYFMHKRGCENPDWRTHLPLDCRHYLDKSVALLQAEGPAKKKTLLHADCDPELLFGESMELAGCWQFEQSNELLQKLLFVDPDHACIYYNNLGYNFLRAGQYEQAADYLLKAIQVDPELAYAHDNLGLCYIMLGELQRGRDSVLQAMDLPDNHSGYSNRNLGVYWSMKGDQDQAEMYFMAARNLGPVDDLDYFHALHCLKFGQQETGKQLLQQANAAGDPKAALKLGELE